MLKDASISKQATMYVPVQLSVGLVPSNFFGPELRRDVLCSASMGSARCLKQPSPLFTI